MSTYIDFSVAMLDAVADFLMVEPINYLFGMILFCFVANIFMTLMGRRSKV